MGLVQIKSDPRARDKPCLRCGYSLRHIVDSRHCPECGLSAWISLGGNDALDASNPDWLRKVLAAVALLAGAALVALAGWLAAPALGSSKAWVVVGLWGAVYLAMHHGAMLLLSAQEGRYPDRCRPHRRFGLFVGVVGLAVAALLVGQVIVFFPADPAQAHRRWVGWVCFLLCFSHIGAWLHLAALARRVPSRQLRKAALWACILPPLYGLWLWPTLGRMVQEWIVVAVRWLPGAYLTGSAAILICLGLRIWKALKSAQEMWEKETAR